MSYLGEINYQYTKRKQSIVLKSKWIDLMDAFLFVFAICSFIICLILIFIEADLKNPNDSFVAYWILPFLFAFTLVLLYKKMREKRLLTVKTNLKKGEAREKIVELVKSWQWEIHRNNADYLQATTSIGLASWGEQVIIIYDDKKIHLNVMSNNPKVRMPLLFSDKSIKKDIEKQLKSSD